MYIGISQRIHCSGSCLSSGLQSGHGFSFSSSQSAESNCWTQNHYPHIPKLIKSVPVFNQITFLLVLYSINDLLGNILKEHDHTDNKDTHMHLNY